MHCNHLHCVCEHFCYKSRVPSRKRNLAPAPSASALGNDSQLVVRLPAALVRRVDQFAERMRAELPGTRFARAEAVRVLLTRALDQRATRVKV